MDTDISSDETAVASKKKEIQKSKAIKRLLPCYFGLYMPCVCCLALVNQHLYVVSKQNRLTKRRETGSAVNTTIHTDDLATTTSYYSENASVKKAALLKSLC